MPPRSIPRPMSYPFANYLEDAANGLIPPSTVTIKEDGFCIKNIRQTECADEEGRWDDGAYFSKANNAIRITDEPKTMMEAIVLYVRTKFPGLIAANIVDEYTYLVGGRGRATLKHKCVRARELRFEFVALKDGRSYMKGLWTKECLDPVTRRLDERDFSYNVVVFDCAFDEDEDDLPYFQRREIMGDSLARLFTPRVGRAMVCEQVESAKDMLDDLLTQEGLVLHMANGTCWKVKMPRVVMNLRIVAVANTIADFSGYNLIYVAAPNEDDGATWSVVHVFDWTELFTKYDNPRQGRPFINQRSVKIMEDGRLGCTSSCKTMQPLVDAVFRAVSGCTLLPASKGLTKTKAVARVTGEGEVTVFCGVSRSFSFTMNGMTKDNGPLFLTEPLDATVGCSELREISDGELHLQAAWLLALEGYGPDEYRTMAFHTSTRVLREIAQDLANDPKKNYNKVGMVTDPFLGLRQRILRVMTAKFFFVPK